MIKKSIYLRAVTGLILVMLLFSLSIEPAGATTGISNITITNVRDVTFVVSWTTAIASNGSVTWGSTTPPSNTVTDGVSSTTTHYVTISGLLANQTYYFQVTSGDETDNNGDAYYQVTTGPFLIPPTPAHTIRGYVYLSDGTTIVPNAIVYLQLQDFDEIGSPGSSQLISVRTDDAGRWSYTLSNTRTSDLSSSFIFTAGMDKLQIIGQGGSNGTVGIDPTWIITVPTADPARQDVTLSQGPTAVLVSSFTGKVTLNNVQLDWETASEVGLVGFNVYRSDSLGGMKQKLNTDMLSAKNPGQLIGATYQFSNAVGQGQHYHYWLELVLTEETQFIDSLVVDTNYWVLLPVLRR